MNPFIIHSLSFVEIASSKTESLPYSLVKNSSLVISVPI